MKWRYNTSGTWYKGNTHIHSTASDGGKTLGELATMYAEAGYSFLFRTDHWVTSDASSDPAQYPLLWLDGIELDGRDYTGAGYHVVCLGRVAGVRSEDGIEAAMQSARSQGALTILAHPHWCGNSLADCLRWPFDGVEIYNHVCHWLNGKGAGMVHWDAALMRDPSTLGFAVDDSHLRAEHPGWNGGWIMVNSSECTPKSIMDAIRNAHYYSSCGPEFHSIVLDGDYMQVETSPVSFARLVGPGANGQRMGSFDGDVFETVRFPIPDDWRYMYLEIEDQNGRRAWTNTLFIAD